MANPTVKCNVANCSFWGEGNNCHAQSILVEIDSHAGEDYGTEMASESYISEQLHEESATSKAATCCKTFTPKK
ncbi:DUF1540 domain-containing protein [bacterium LRH843]|nr:DUF1540 domain-containing protein [bacterium LRH843]